MSAKQKGNIPASISSFVGRTQEVAEARALLRRARLLTLRGAGGIGKSRLALEVSRKEEDDYADGAWVVELASVADEAMLPNAVAAALGLRDESSSWLPAALVRFLRPQRLLLVLDNCEHLGDACATLVDVLLRGAPDLRVIATSRESLGIIGEHVWQVPPLLPEDAVQLFVERGEAVGAVEVRGSAAEAVARELCARLDFMPLAIELASARLPTLSVQQIAERIGFRFRLLSSDTRTGLARHQTLWDTIEWSFQLLADEEKLLFGRLACFQGSFSLAAAEAIGTGGELPQDRVLDILSRLVRKSLVVREPGRTEARYRLLQTIREYGLEQLQTSGEETSLRNLHATFFLTLAEEAEGELMGRAPDAAVSRLLLEDVNFEAALRWAQESDQRDLALRILDALWRSWDRSGRVAVGRAWMQRFIDPRTPPTSNPLLVRTALGAMVLALRQGDLVVARELGEQWMPLAQGLGDDQHYAFWLVEMGHVSLRNRNFDRAKSHFQEGLNISRSLGIDRIVAACIAGLGAVAVSEGDPLHGRGLLEQALDIQRALGDNGEIAGTMLLLGHSWLWHNDAKRARPYFLESLAIWRQLGVSRGIGEVLYGLGHTHMALGDLTQAAHNFRESLDISRDLGNVMTTAECLDGLAMLAALRGQHVQAWRAAGAADNLRDSVGMGYPQYMQELRDRRLQPASRALSPSARSRAWQFGRGASLDTVIEGVLDEREQPTTGLTRLTRRELEVAALIAEGLTNRQISARLFITERTAETHVEHILNKLGFHSRAQIAAWTIENRPSSGHS